MLCLLAVAVTGCLTQVRFFFFFNFLVGRLNFFIWKMGMELYYTQCLTGDQ
jgi:hypothetical protein